MRILFLAPQPFFQERGTPIAVRLALKVLSERNQDSIDLLTFHEGENLIIENVSLHRIPALPFICGVRPGFSLKKVACDLVFFLKAFKMLLFAKLSGKPYALVHAVEESVFMALLFRVLFKVPYIYDMDSSLALQLTEKIPVLKLFKVFFEKLEALAIRKSLAVIPVCDALAVIAQNKKALHVEVLPDISLKEDDYSEEESPDLRSEIGLSSDQSIILYVGNLEHYQGVELLVESFALGCQSEKNWHLVVIGGNSQHIKRINERVLELGLQGRVHLPGLRPVSLLGHYLRQADILASPRILGNNTPMKIYSYMHSGVAIIATDLATHTQVLNSEMALLVRPTPDDFGRGLLELSRKPELRGRLAGRAMQEAEAKYTFPIFRKTLIRIYETVAEKISP